MLRTRDKAEPDVQVRKQATLRKDGDGWVMERRPTARRFPHSGHPELLATREG